MEMLVEIPAVQMACSQAAYGPAAASPVMHERPWAATLQAQRKPSAVLADGRVQGWQSGVRSSPQCHH